MSNINLVDLCSNVMDSLKDLSPAQLMTVGFIGYCISMVAMNCSENDIIDVSSTQDITMSDNETIDTTI